MILLIGVVGGLLAAFVRSKVTKRPIRVVYLRGWWLVLVVFFLQWLAFTLPGKTKWFPGEWVSVVFTLSLVFLLLFIWLNRRQPGAWLLWIGVLCNYLVIVLNGGLMPISPDTVQKLIPDAPVGSWQVGERIGSSKDIVIPNESMQFPYLADRFVQWFGPHYRVAYSVGDILIVLGIFWLCWSLVDQ